ISRTARRASAGVSTMSGVRLRSLSALATLWSVCSDAAVVNRSAVWLMEGLRWPRAVPRRLVLWLELRSYQYLTQKQHLHAISTVVAQSLRLLELALRGFRSGRQSPLRRPCSRPGEPWSAPCVPAPAAIACN